MGRDCSSLRFDLGIGADGPEKYEGAAGSIGSLHVSELEDIALACLRYKSAVTLRMSCISKCAASLC